MYTHLTMETPNQPPAIGTYYVPKITVPRHFETKQGVSKKQEYLQIAGVPCIVKKADSEYATLNGFTSATNRYFKITLEDLDTNFEITTPDSDGFLHLEAYPNGINISEFDTRAKLDLIIKGIKTNIKILPGEKIYGQVRQIIEDKLFQLIQSQGAPYITIPEYHQFKNNEIALGPHKRFGHAIFNRNCRWCPPIDMTFEEYEQSSSYPAPLGIRPKDFCLPSELIITMNALINLIVNFDGIDDVSFEEIKKCLPDISRTEQCCKYCGEKINIEKYCSEYKSCDNYIEICHRDPNDRFLSRNMYWGHGECNRRQGGYSETDRMNDGTRLLFVNKLITKEEYEKLLQ